MAGILGLLYEAQSDRLTLLFDQRADIVHYYPANFNVIDERSAGKTLLSLGLFTADNSESVGKFLIMD